MNEFELIAKLTKNIPSVAPDLVRGVGDDCAIIAGPDGRDWLVTQDALLESVHFRREWTDMGTLGNKALAVNLSDIAAMGGTPRFYLVSIGLPADMRAKCAEQIFAGMRECASAFNVVLIGGDTVRSPSGLTLSITVIGEVEKDGAILRCTARAGDVIYATGTLGAAALGLSCLNAGESGGDADCFVNRHNRPTPRVQAGKVLAQTGSATSMIDVSDGLVGDLSHVADASGVGFRIELIKVPVEPGFRALARRIGVSPEELMLSGGEDYELLFTVRPAHADVFDKDVVPRLGVPATRIGTVIGEKNRREVVDADGKFFVPEIRGFDHFE
jgi:thiamine-monophosphate kinase